MRAQEPRLVAIVDAYSSGHLLPHWFRSNGFDSIHVASSNFVQRKHAKSYRPADFCDEILYAGDLRATAEALRRRGVTAVIAGSETGVLLADLLASSIPGVPTNGVGKSPARRDKSLLSASLLQAGLSAVPEERVTSAAAAASSAAALGAWPLVVKPTSSAGGDGVTLCADEHQLRDAVDAIIGSTNKIGVKNEAAVVQKYLQGDVFSVNTVSCYGKHYVTNIWQYKKSGFLYDHEFLIPAEGATQDKLTAYAFDALDALEIRFGPAHIEMINTETGPIIVDFGARLHGCDSPSINRECTGVGQDELTADAFTAPAEFMRKTAAPYRIYKHLMTVDFISPVSGIVTSLEPFDAIKRLPSYHLLRLDVTMGDRIDRTVDLFTSPGLVELIHRDQEQLRKDLVTIRSLESSSLYAVDSR